jgi:hypothetical protein
MDINSIIGITWFALCSHGFIHGCRAGIGQIRGPRRIRVPKSAKPLFWSAYAFYCLLFLAGIAASISLFLGGSSWARWLIGLVVIVELFKAINLLYASVTLVTLRKPRILKTWIILIVSLISLALLFSGGGIWHQPDM